MLGQVVEGSFRFFILFGVRRLRVVRGGYFRVIVLGEPGEWPSARHPLSGASGGLLRKAAGQAETTGRFLGTG